MKKIFEISQLLTWYHTISAEGAEDWWWRCWTKSFQTFRFVAVSSPPTTWSRTTDHFPPVIYVIWVQIQLHFVNAFFKKKLAKHFPSKWNALLPPFPVLYIYTEMVQRVRKVEGHLHACDRSFRSASWHLSIVFHNFSSVNMQPWTWYQLVE